MAQLAPYLKAVAPFAAGVVLVALGAVLGDADLRALGIGAIGASGLSFVAPNRK